MSVLFIQERTHRAGAQTCLMRLLRTAPIRAWRPVLLCGEEGWLSKECRANGIEVIVERFPRSRSLLARLFGNARFAKRVAGRLSALNIAPSIVHANDHLEALLGLKIVDQIPAHKAIFLRSPGMNQRDYIKYRCSRYELVATVGNDFQELVQRWDPSREIELIHDGIEAREFGPPKPKPAEAPRRILVLGSPLAWKGWADLVDALVLLERRGKLPLLQFDFTGREPQASQNDLGLQRLQSARCNFLGRVEAFRELVLGYDLAINPSRMETFGMAAIEVLAAGVPLLSSRSGVIEQVLLPEFLFPAGKPAALAETLGKTMENWPAIDFGVAHSQQAIREKFLIDRAAAKLDSAYRKLTFTS